MGSFGCYTYTQSAFLIVRLLLESKYILIPTSSTMYMLGAYLHVGSLNSAPSVTLRPTEAKHSPDSESPRSARLRSQTSATEWNRESTGNYTYLGR